MSSGFSLGAENSEANKVMQRKTQLVLVCQLFEEKLKPWVTGKST